MSLAHLARHALSMPPRQAAAKAARFIVRALQSRLLGMLLRRQCTYPPLDPAVGRLARRLTPIDPALLAPIADDLRRDAVAARAHRFDLLGSGPVEVAHGIRCAGFGPWHYQPGRPPAGDWRDAIASQARPPNQPRARHLLGLVADPLYRPIDWHLDFKSGYRWSPRTFGAGIPYGHKPGVDVKVPWELARLQHLPRLALAYTIDRAPWMAAEFRHQVLDFLGSNPPGWGVNWTCAMDVAIRGVNILLALDLFRAAGAAFDDVFEAELTAAMLAHLRHLAGHLEWNENHRGNHYLADICGLAFIAGYLPRSEEADILLAFAVRQLQTELPRQFTADGANFEGSTAYHRLSTEMAIYTVALIQGLPADKRTALTAYDAALWQRHPPLAPAPVAWPPFAPETLKRLAGAARFALDVTKPSGEMVQIGDNDSGRFVVLTPTSLDPRHLVAAAKGLLALDLPSPPASTVETAVVRALAGGTFAAPPPLPPPLPLPRPAAAATAAAPGEEALRLVRVVIAPPDPAALDGLEPIAYPDFGLFVWRNARSFVAIRCGPIGQNGNGGHAHNDQLAVEIEIDGTPWARDPGTFVYTPDLAARNRYRSALAHFVPRPHPPRHDTDEPAGLVAPFRLEDRAQARAWHFDDSEFLGSHRGFGEAVFRRVLVGNGAIVIEDGWGGPVIGAATAITEHRVETPAALAALWGLTLPFSAGYGLSAAARVAAAP